MPQKQSRDELRHPDQFVTFWTRFAALIARHRLVGVGALVAALVVAFAIWGGTSLLDGEKAKVSRAFARIGRIANAPLIPATGDAPKYDDDLPHFKTESERQEAAAKEVDNFLAAHPSGPLHADALILRGRYQLMGGKAKEAISSYESALAANLDPTLKFLAQEGLGLAYETNGQLDKALEVYDGMAKEVAPGGTFYRDRVLYNKARVLEAKGSAKEALALLHEVLEKSPTSALRDEINNRLAVLEGK